MCGNVHRPRLETCQSPEQRISESKNGKRYAHGDCSGLRNLGPRVELNKRLASFGVEPFVQFLVAHVLVFWIERPELRKLIPANAVGIAGIFGSEGPLVFSQSAGTRLVPLYFANSAFQSVYAFLNSV